MSAFLQACISTTFAFAAAVFLLTHTHGLAFAQAGEFQESKLDVVQFGPAKRKVDSDWASNKVVTYTGRIQRFNADSLVMLTSEGKRTVPSDRVVSVSPSWGPSAAVAMDALKGRRYEQAYDLLYAALKEEASPQMPEWQQKLVISAAVRAKWAVGETRIAGVLFGRLAASSLPDMLYADLPLCWSTESPTRSVAAASKEWVVSEQPTLQLLGASWLLLGPESTVATTTLQRLAKDDQTTIGTLAKLQLWRAVSPPETMKRVSAWMETRDRLLPPLQLGPTEFLADRLLRIGETELAVGQMLRIATEPHGRYHRAHRVLVRARDALRSKDFQSEAEKLEVWIKELGPADNSP